MRRLIESYKGSTPIVILKKGIIYFTIILILFVSCNFTSIDSKRKKTFVLTKDSTYIGTWYSKVISDGRLINEIITMYSKDSILYFYEKQYGQDNFFYKYEFSSENEMMNYCISDINETQFKSYLDTIDDGTYHYLFGNDSILYLQNDSMYNENNGKIEYIAWNKKYYQINNDNSLSKLAHYVNKDKNGNLVTDIDTFFTLPIYTGKKIQK